MSRRDATERGDIYVYVASYGEYDEEKPKGRLGFTDEEDAKEWATETNTVLSDNAEWEFDSGAVLRCEDKIGNWAEVERVRISDPEGFLAYE
jgi:hypothetical protein